MPGDPKFWKVHDDIFKHQKEISARNIESKALEFAKAAGANSGRFKSCYQEKKTLKAVQKDLAEAQALDINGTPAFVVNGHLVSGADGDLLKRIIDEALQGKHGGTK